MQINNIGELSKNLIIDLKELNKSETKILFHKNSRTRYISKYNESYK